MATPGPTLTCAQCGYVNEAERVYCHNCGTKLDRSLLPKPQEGKQESLEKTRRRVKKMTNPGGGPLPVVKTFISVLIYAALAAALLLLALPPDNIPGRMGLVDRLVNSDLLDGINSPQPRQLTFSENDVNSHLRGVKAKVSPKGKTSIPGLEFRRAFVRFEPGLVKIYTERALAGYSLYASTDYEVSVTNGQFTTRQRGAYYGRLGIHPMIMEHLNFTFSNLWKALKREHEQMQRMQSVRVEKGRIILVTKPAGAP